MWRAGADVDVVVFIISRHTSKENSHILCFLLFVTVNGTHEPFEPFMLSLLGMEIDHDIATIFKLQQDENLKLNYCLMVKMFSYFFIAEKMKRFNLINFDCTFIHRTKCKLNIK